MGEFPSGQVTILPSLVVTGVVKGGDILFLVCHATSRDFVVRKSSGIMDEFPSSYVTTLQSLVIVGLVEEEILRFHFVT